MMIRLNVSAHIYRPLTQVFTFVATPENDFQWQYGTLSSAPISRGEIGIGSAFRTVHHFMGRRIESVYEVTEFETDKKYGFTSRSGPVDSHTLYTFEVSESSTRVNVSTETDPKGIFKTEGMIIERKFRKQYQENLALLKSILEVHRIVNP